MPQPPKPSEPPIGNAPAIRTQVTLDAATLSGLDDMIAEEPDIQSRSAAIRKLVRDRKRKTNR